MPHKIIFKEYKKYALDYIVLFLLLFSGLLAFLFSPNLPLNQSQIAKAMGLSYFFWSLFHHYRRRDLTLGIVIEYLVLILFVLVVLSLNSLRA